MKDNKKPRREFVINFHVPRKWVKYFRLLASNRARLALCLVVAILLVTEILPAIQAGTTSNKYDLTPAIPLLPKTSSGMASKLNFDSSKKTYTFNGDFNPASARVGSGGPLIMATASSDPRQGFSVTDPMNQASLTIKPQFRLDTAKRDSNRVFYPLGDGSGWAVYTMQAGLVREDIILTHSDSNTVSLPYKLDLGDSFVAKKTPAGSIAIYGSSLPINGQVSTGSDKDAAVLQKLRRNSEKNHLLFTLPAPVISQIGGTSSKIQAHYELKGDVLTLNVSGLKGGHYPIDIDPSVYVQSAVGLMYGNNETNVDFDTANNLLEKTPVSGGNIRDGVTQTSWSNTTVLPTGLFNMGTAITADTIYVVGGSSGSTNVTTLYWANINNANDTIGTWNTNSAYNLPAPLSALSVVAYNDYLYAIGGYNSTTSAVVNTVYRLHVAVNGEPTPTWAATTNLPANLQYTGAVAYQNELYILGGQSSRTNTGLTNTYSAAINPDGSLNASWTSTTALSSATFGMGVVTYNGYIYVVGGTVAGSTVNTVAFAKITSPGTISSWQTTNTFTTARTTSGGNFVTIWAGYMYVSGGCTTVNASGFCTATPQGDIQEASVSADGSLSTWTTLQYYTGSAFANISQVRLGYGLLSAGSAVDGGTLYAIGGCAAALNSSTGACTTALTTTTYANISNEGDVGPAQATTSLPSGTSGAGAFASGVVINNGYIYNIGGCQWATSGTTNACGTMVPRIYYAPINADGTVGSWSVTTNALPQNLAAMGSAVFNNEMYVCGGINVSTDTSSCFYGALSSTGDLGAMSTATAILPAAAHYPFAFTHTNPATPTSGYLYLIGGCQLSSGSGIGCTTTTYQATVTRCTITGAAPAPASCSHTNSANLMQLPRGTGIAAGAVSGNYVYYSSGANALTSGTAGTWGGQTNLTYYAKIDSSGNIVCPPGRTCTSNYWPTITGLLVNNGQTDASADNAPGQRRRATAYAVNGYLYILAGHDAEAANGSGATLTDIEIGKIDPTTGDIASFVDDYQQITPRWDFKGAAANGFIYAVGGCSAGSPPANCTAEDDAVQYIQVYNNYSGSPATYNSGTNMTNPVIGTSSAIYNGKIYVAGGTTSYGGSPTTELQYASINSNGSIGSWTTITSGNGVLGTARQYFKLVASNGYLYAIGGQSSTTAASALATTEKSLLNPSTGVPGAFSADATMTTARSGLDAVVYNGYIYAVGGENTAGTMLNSVERSQINTSTHALGAWTTTGNTSFTTARMFLNAVAYNGTLYVLGGTDGTNYFNDAQFAQLNSDGTMGSFSTTQNLPQPVSQGTAFASNGYLYVLAGRSGTGTTGCTDNTYAASVLANSTVANGNIPNGLGNWSQTNIAFSGARYGATASYSGGKAYLFGGSQCASNAVVTAATSSYYATLQSQPQIAQYSYAIDAINDVFPSKSLFNGIDNGIGASWALDYRSSTNANNSWGLDVVYGNMTLGTAQSYIPEDGGGTNTNFARWFWLEATIDDSQAFGYPEDVTRGPTIKNFLLEFTANPSGRLRNGKTFINNVQQPLDTPF